MYIDNDSLPFLLTLRCILLRNDCVLISEIKKKLEKIKISYSVWMLNNEIKTNSWYVPFKNDDYFLDIYQTM